MFKLVNKEEKKRYDIPHTATIKFQGSLDSDRYGLHISIDSVEQSLVADDYEAHIEIYTEWLTLKEGTLLNKKFQSLDGLTIFETVQAYDQEPNHPAINPNWVDRLDCSDGGGSILMCYVDQPLDMSMGVLTINHSSGNDLKLLINGDIDIYIIEIDTMATYLGGSISIDNELGNSAQDKLFTKFNKTFDANEYKVTYREVAGVNTILEFVPLEL